MVTLRVGVLGGTGRLNAGPTLVALGRGYFAKEGLEVELVDVAGDTGMPMVTEGELDAAALRPSLYFYKAWDPARPMALVADQGRQVAGRGAGAIVARVELVKQGVLRDYEDLRGKRVGLSPDRGDHDWLTVAAALEKGGLTFDDVELVDCDYGPGRHQALADGSVDVTTVSRASSVAEGVQAGAFLPWKYESEVEEGRQSWAVIFGSGLRLGRPDLAVRYMVAYLRGARAYYDAFESKRDRDAIVGILASYAGMDREKLGRSIVPLGFDPDGHLNVESISADLAWMNAHHALDTDIPLEGVVDESYLGSALAEVGPYRGSKGV